MEVYSQVSVQAEDFDPSKVIKQLQSCSDSVGAVVSFVGCVRDNKQKTLQTLEIEHYLGMTQKVITDVIKQAQAQWGIINSMVIHRIGRLKVGDNIVIVACASTHRQDAFLACEFIMDFLKTDAPFWKKETTKTGGCWIEQN